jgi:hypothetical protein
LSYTGVVHKAKPTAAATGAGFFQIHTGWEYEMNDANFTGIRMKKADWNRLPAVFRKVEPNEGLMVLAAGNWAPVLIVD